MTRWIAKFLDGLYPVVPGKDFASAEVVEQPSKVLGGPSVGERPTGTICKSCNGSRTIGRGGPPGSMSYHIVPCPECNNPLLEELNKALVYGSDKDSNFISRAADIEIKNTCDGYGSSGELVYGSDECGKPLQSNTEFDYDAIESFETPAAKDFMIDCEFCDGGITGEGFICADCRGDGKVLPDKRKTLRYRESHWCPTGDVERFYSALLCCWCRGNDIDLTTDSVEEELEAAKKRIVELEEMLKLKDMIKVEIESPFAAPTVEEIEINIKYARACVMDCLKRGEAPYASHLFFTQEGILDDTVPEERKLGMEAGKVWTAAAEKTAVYTDRGMSGGMKWGIEEAEKIGRPVEYRELGGKWVQK